MTRKYHQILIVHGITLLQMNQAIIDRRRQCEVIDYDLLLWPNQSLYLLIITWARGIGFGEYADNLRGINIFVPSTLTFHYIHFVQLHRERHS